MWEEGECCVVLVCAECSEADVAWRLSAECEHDVPDASSTLRSSGGYVGTVSAGGYIGTVRGCLTWWVSWVEMESAGGKLGVEVSVSCS